MLRSSIFAPAVKATYTLSNDSFVELKAAPALGNSELLVLGLNAFKNGRTITDSVKLTEASNNLVMLFNAEEHDEVLQESFGK